MIKKLPAMQARVQYLEGMATHSSIPAWRIPWTQEPGRLQSMGLQRVGQNWAVLVGRSKERKNPWNDGRPYSCLKKFWMRYFYERWRQIVFLPLFLKVESILLCCCCHHHLCYHHHNLCHPTLTSSIWYKNFNAIERENNKN